MNKHSYSTNKKRVLVADDDTAILHVLTLMLEDAGYEVTSTVDGETVQKVLSELPDLILLDIWMSGVDGRDICKQLKSNKKTKHIPIIMISANKDTRDIAKEAGADDFIPKPFEMSDLLTIVKKYVNK
ncbi:MAG: response regulator [bacterium]|nr:response regulator [bacterium]